jgi:threonyl-tRNA synthetase
LETAFKDSFNIDLIASSAVTSNESIESGHFFYDSKLNIKNWKASKEELRCLSITMNQLIQNNLIFEHLAISRDLATEMFKHNEYKLGQLLATNDDNKINVCKVGDYVDISNGIMIGSTSCIGRFEVTAIHDINSKTFGPIQRVQGISIPKDLNVSAFTF